MSALAIYVFVVTGLYFVYMAVVIMMDLFSKTGQKKDDSEVFDNADMGVDNAEEESTVVDESDNGYITHKPGESLGNEGAVGDVSAGSNDDEDSHDDRTVDEKVNDEDILEQESQESQAAYESLKAVQANMDAVTPVYQDEYSSSDFAVIMAQPINNKTKILRQIIRQ